MVTLLSSVILALMCLKVKGQKDSDDNLDGRDFPPVGRRHIRYMLLPVLHCLHRKFSFAFERFWDFIIQRGYFSYTTAIKAFFEHFEKTEGQKKTQADENSSKFSKKCSLFST